MSRGHCTIKDIARVAEVSLSTVSYGLRNHPRIPKATCERIQAVAQRLGYKLNPHVAALMAIVRRGRSVRTVENLALIWPQGTRQFIKEEDLCRKIVAGFEERAYALGYGIAQFWMEEDRLAGSRLSTILSTRNIRGLIFAPAFRGSSLDPAFDWSKFTTVVLGHAQWAPEMHRAMPNHYHAVRECLDHLALLGAKAPAAVISDDINRRTDFAQEAAFLTHHPKRAAAPKLIFFTKENNLADVPRWLNSIKADSVIFGKNEIFEHCRRTDERSIANRHLMTLEWNPDHHQMPGVMLRYDLVAAAAVDLLVVQLQTNQLGVPSRPRVIVMRGDWMDGAAIRGPAPQR